MALRLLLLFVLAVWMKPTPSVAQIVVHKTAEPFGTGSWIVSDDSSAGGSIRLSPDVPAEIQAVSTRSLEMDASFSGAGFEAFSVVPRTPLVIPGESRSFSVWVRSEAPDYDWNLNFTDGWGRSEVEGQKLEWTISKGVGNTWKRVTFAVPAGWVQPLTISSILVHNWGSQTKKATVRLWVDDLEVDTDIANVIPETGRLRTWTPPSGPAVVEPLTPLVTTSLVGTQEHNVFSGTPASFRFQVRNWNPAPATGTIRWSVTDYRGDRLRQANEPWKASDNSTLEIPLPGLRFGVYHLESTVSRDGSAPVQLSQPFAVIPAARELTEDEKDRSPYGLNVLSARQPMVSTFRKAGIIWYRDYGFNFDWLLRAKGADRSYSGWPWYPRIMKQYEASGVRVLADLQTAIRPPVSGQKPGPDLEWTRDLADIILSFPAVSAFELDNEYDLKPEHIKAEEPIHWQNYLDYHRKFGEVVRLLGSSRVLAVENGRAGIWPERVRAAVKSGAFENIDVVNSHYYAGVEPPELSILNHNMGLGPSERYLSFFDQLREVKRAARSDGKPRQHWLTEFGWDTKAGPVVTPVQQSAYLARMYMMLLAAGTEKGFWFFDLDSPDAKQFFDGCGLFTFDQMPKLSYAAYAGLTQMLPSPEYLGMINAGPGTTGYLFRSNGQMVASLWSVTGDQRPTAAFDGAKVYDFLANPLESSTVKLVITPVYAVGISPDSPWFRQAAYSLETPYLVAGAAGDTVTIVLHIRNDRQGPIKADARMLLPPGWTTPPAGGSAAGVTVMPGHSADIPLTFRIGPDEALGERSVSVLINEGAWQYAIPLRVQTRQQVALSVQGLTGEPGSAEVTVTISNLSTRPQSGALRFRLPASWSTDAAEIKISALKPGEHREVHARVHWTADWQPGESAWVEYRGVDGPDLQQPLIPDRLAIHRVRDDLADARPNEWPPIPQIPAWVLGSTAGDPRAAVSLGWSKRGLYVAVNVHDSRALVPDPKSFWVGDALELFIDTNRPTARQFGPGVHQFWMVPRLDTGSVYIGRWKRGAEIGATRYDIPGIRSTSRRTPGGYLMECLIPASLIDGFNPTVGARMGLNLNLSVKGSLTDREVFWPHSKTEGIADHPDQWGAVTLEP